MSEPAQSELGTALARIVSVLDRVRLEDLQPSDRDLVEEALREASAALVASGELHGLQEPFPQED